MSRCRCYESTITSVNETIIPQIPHDIELYIPKMWERKVRFQISLIPGVELMCIPSLSLFLGWRCMWGMEYMLIYIGTCDSLGIRAKWEMLGNLCSPNAIGPMPDWDRLCAANELPTNLDLIELNEDQTLGGRVWISFRLPLSRIPTPVNKCGIPWGIESILVVILEDCSI